MRFLDKYSSHEKHLRRLGRETDRLRLAYWHAPIVPLEQPYQRGWVKTFVLEPRVLQRSDAHIFREVLRIVNDFVYSTNREFRSRRGFPIVLRPQRIGMHQWEKLAWPASHRRLFQLGHWTIEDEVFRRPGPRLWRRGYKLAIDWWLREDIQPFMITHQRVDVPEVRSRLAEIESYMTRIHGWDRLDRLYGRRRWWLHLRKTRTEHRARVSLADQLRTTIPD